MRTTTMAMLTALALAVGASGCRPDPGPSKYDEQEMFPTGGPSNLLPGPNPYVVGTKRLSVGAFYEGGSSDLVPINNMDTNLYIYGLNPDGSDPTVGLQSDPDHIEGLSSTRVTDLGKMWSGFGVHWMAARDLSAWTKMHVSLKSSTPVFAKIDVAMNNAMPRPVHLQDYGWKADGEWHSLEIPVADFVAQGLDVTVVEAPFAFAGGPSHGGETVLIDDLYFTAD
jgi:hypothetical protein